MSKPWVGFLSSALLLVAGALYIADGSSGLGALFITVAAASAILNIYIYKRKRK